MTPFRTGSLLFIFLLILTVAAVAQEDVDHIQWFESFFDKAESASAEKKLQASNAVLENAIQSDDVNGQAKALNEIALVHFTFAHDYDKAMEFFIRALTLEEGMEVTEQKIFTYAGIAQVFLEAGDYNKSAYFLEQALG